MASSGGCGSTRQRPKPSKPWGCLSRTIDSTALPTVPVDDKMRILNAIVEAVNAREVNEALLTDDFELVNVSNALTDKTYRGASGAREWQHDFFDVLDENARFEITEIVEAGEDYLVVRNRLVGTGSASGVPFDMEWFSAWWFRDGRLARGVGYKAAVRRWRQYTGTLTPTPEPAGYCAGDVAGERGTQSPSRRTPSTGVTSTPIWR